MNRIDEINEEISRLHKEKEEIQEQCPHPPLCFRYQFQGDSGNWDRNEDSYWTNNSCTLCGKRWTVSGSVSGPKGSKQVDSKDNL